MPQTLSAKKALRKDRRRTKTNELVKTQVKKALKQTRKQPNQKTLSAAASVLDRAVKKSVIHKRKAARLQSRLAKLLAKSSTSTNKTQTAAPAKKAKKSK